MGMSRNEIPAHHPSPQPIARPAVVLASSGTTTQATSTAPNRSGRHRCDLTFWHPSVGGSGSAQALEAAVWNLCDDEEQDAAMRASMTRARCVAPGPCPLPSYWTTIQSALCAATVSQQDQDGSRPPEVRASHLCRLERPTDHDDSPAAEDRTYWAVGASVGQTARTEIAAFLQEHRPRHAGDDAELAERLLDRLSEAGVACSRIMPWDEPEPHAQASMVVEYWAAMIDLELLVLVEQLWLAGIPTLASCQGSQNGQAYLVFPAKAPPTGSSTGSGTSRPPRADPSLSTRSLTAGTSGQHAGTRRRPSRSPARSGLRWPIVTGRPRCGRSTGHWPPRRTSPPCPRPSLTWGSARPTSRRARPTQQV